MKTRSTRRARGYQTLSAADSALARAFDHVRRAQQAAPDLATFVNLTHALQALSPYINREDRDAR